MKILFISVFRDGTGYSHGAAEYVKALYEAGTNVVCRTIKLNNENYIPPQIIQDLEKQSSKGCDVNIQYVLPSMMENTGYMKNIALYASETNYFGNCNWADMLNTMDKILVINSRMAETAIKSGVNNVPKVVYHPINIRKCHSSYQPYNLDCDKQSFKFYFIGEMNKRKNLRALIKAFHLEFDPDENVDLVIKTSYPGMNAGQAKHAVIELINKIKRGMKLYSSIEGYKQEVIITERLTDEQIMELHTACDVYICPSFGEAWNIGAAEAMAMGKTPIVTGKAGMDYVSNGGWVVDSHNEPVYGMVDTLGDIYVGNELWKSIDVTDLRKKMREAYENKEKREQLAENGMDFALNFDYNKIGQKMLEAING